MFFAWSKITTSMYLKLTTEKRVVHLCECSSLLVLVSYTKNVRRMCLELQKLTSTSMLQWCMVRISVSYFISTNFERDLAGNFRNTYLPLFDLFKSSLRYLSFFETNRMMSLNPVSLNDVFDCLNPVSSWRYVLWSPHGSPY